MNPIVNHPSVNININLTNKNVLLRTVGEKDFIILNSATINLYNNNAVVTSQNEKHNLVYLMDKFHQYDYKYGLVQSQKRKPIHLLTDEFIVVLHSPIIERLDFEDPDLLRMNIVANYIEPIFQPNTYIRKAKLEKIMEKINARKKNRTSFNKRIQV